jgi:hypothetical protein
MGWGSYIKRFTGEVSRNVPVLKPATVPFSRRTAPHLAKPEAESAVPPVSHPDLATAAETAAVAPQILPVASRRTELAPAPPLDSYSLETRSLAPPPASIPRLHKAQTRESAEQPISKEDAWKPSTAEPSSSFDATTVGEPKTNVAVPSFRPIHHRARRSRPSEQEDITERSPVTPAPAGRPPLAAAVLFSSARHSKASDEGSDKRRQAEDSAASAISPRSLEAEHQVALADPAKSPLELRTRKNLADGDHAPAPIRVELRPAQHSPLPTAHRPVQEPQARTTGGIHIGTVEVRIVPPPAPAPPIIKPRQANPSSATTLSRSFTSSFGLNQGQ